MISELFGCMQTDTLLSELRFRATRSGGPGGQHVNKVNSRVELYWPLNESQGVTDQEKRRIRKELAKRLNKEGVLVLWSEKTRSQRKNKELVTRKFLRLLEKAMRPTPKRIPTKTPRSAHKSRLDKKKRNALKKALRRPPSV